ncbi:MAG: ATP-binding cassette domain-containing protein, partial [Paramuribaculum sp.]|nr:ATP-binding cassette domain-containing protein [Paramuribaculum sp.]
WISSALERLEIGGKIDTPAGRMSVGQQQRVAIIRALCQPFDFLLIDEPVSHLDARNNAIVAQLIAEEASRYGATVIATSVGNKISIPVTHTLHL